METTEQTTEQSVEQTTQEAPNFWGDAVSIQQDEIQEQQIEETSIEETTDEVAPTEVEQPVIESTIEKTEPIIQEKIVEVEKVIEKQPEFKDEYTKQLYEALLEGKEDVLKSYLDEKLKDYNSMSDLDVVKEKLQKENPNWTQKDIDAEIKYKYGKSFEFKSLDDLYEDSKEYEQALEHNERVERSLNLLERDSRDSRLWLNEQKKSIELPKITKEAPVEAQQPTEEEIQAMNKQWYDAVEAEIPKLSDLNFKLGDEEVSYKVTDEEKAEFVDKMKNFNAGEYFTKSRGWYDEQGNVNILKVAEDVRKLEKFDKILSSVATQLKTSAKKEVVAEIKNIDLSKGNQSAELNVDLAKSIWS